MIDQINDEETGLSTRNKINSAINAANGYLGGMTADVPVTLTYPDKIGDYTYGDTIPLKGASFEKVINILASKKADPLFNPGWFGEIVQWIDGTIVGNELIDKSGNGYNMNITNNTLRDGYGIPYRSNVLISQKPANYGIIPDPTNFWYTTLGVPNQIPVTALFQSIDYRYQTFTRHLNQVLSPYNGEELIEPRVVEIVTYANVLSGTNLQSANFYFGVPTEISTALWVSDATGNDSTGTGSKTAPWKTIGKANTGTANRTIYVRTGAYSEATAVSLLNNQTWKFIGLCSLTTSDTVGMMCSGTTGTSVEGLTINPSSGGRSFYFISGDNNTVQRCKLNVNGSNSKNVQVLDGLNNILKYSILINNQNTPSVDIRKVGFNVYGNYFGGQQSGVSEIISYNTTALTTDADCKYNHFASGLVTNHGLFLFNVAGNYNIQYNTIRTTGGTNLAYFLAGSSMVGRFKWQYNDISVTNLAAAAIVNIVDPANVMSCTITHNKVVMDTSNGNSAGPFVLIGQPSPVVSFNYIEMLQAAPPYCIAVAAQSVQGSCDISYNTLKTPQDGGTHIVLGSDVDATYDNCYDNSTILGNKIYGVWYYNPNSTTNGSHGIAVFNCKNVKVMYNYVNGANHLVVYKASNRASAMVNTNAICAYNIGINNDGSLFAKTMSGIKFYNNTTYADNPNITTMAGGVYLLASTGAADNCVFKNNIFIDKTPANPNIVLFNIPQPASLTGFVSNNNYLYSRYNKIADLTAVKYTFAQWQGLGYDAQSFNMDVPFSSVVNEEFWPVTPVAGVNLGMVYATGLDISSKFYTAEQKVPALVFKNQSQWKAGAYIQ